MVIIGVVCTDLSLCLRQGATQTGMRGQGGDIRVHRRCNGQHTSPKCKRCRFDSCSRHNISHFQYSYGIGAVTRILRKLCAVYLLNLPCAYIVEVFHVIISIKRLTILARSSMLLCNDLSGNELHRQAGMGSMVTSQSTVGVMVCRKAGNAGDVDSSPALGTIFPIFITSQHDET